MCIRDRNKIIVSFYDFLRLDCGQGGLYGNNEVWCGGYKTWEKIASLNLRLSVGDGQILGAEGMFESDVMDGFNIENNVWPRAFVLADRLWGDAITNLTEAKDRYNGFNQFLRRQGFHPSPL
eukprot:TRINITY_DN7456_c0_g1_i2.p1 TRINITY_DN7456_c0_g1~~TRINITY_DN7456_c0_g1_i2.p1  ORF type:complete len:122 (-),score=37.38 TRINITY_DN7456_c0_g1_i2:51-416(-)